MGAIQNSVLGMIGSVTGAMGISKIVKGQEESNKLQQESNDLSLKESQVRNADLGQEITDMENTQATERANFAAMRDEITPPEFAEAEEYYNKETDMYDEEQAYNEGNYSNVEDVFALHKLGKQLKARDLQIQRRKELYEYLKDRGGSR